MTPAADPFMAGVRPSGLQRGRGGFLRSADDAPYVSDPTGEVCKTGERKGEVKRLKYGSPSNRGREIENDAALVKYRQRLSFLGIGMDDTLAEACRDLTLLDADSAEFKAAADKIAVEADKLTRSWLAADRGSHGHLLCERADTTKVWADILPAGEALGISTATQDAVVAVWLKLLADNGLEVLAVEAACVDDKWHLAGTLDRIVRTTRPLTFVKKSGELVVISENTALIGDLKFGKLRPAHPIQCASYDQSVPYDTETEARGEWGFELSHEHALIFHGSFDPPSFDLVWVDLVAGREHGGETVVQAKRWAARDDVFSVAQIVEGAASDRDPAEEGNFAPSTPIAGEGAADSSPPPSPARCATCNDTRVIGIYPDVACPDCSRDCNCPANACDLGVAAPGCRKARNLALTPDPARLALVQARDTLAANPDEGADLSGAEHGEQWAALQRHYGDLDAAAKSWLADLIGEATRRGVDFHARRNKTLRVFELYRALIGLCVGGGHTDEYLRALLALVIGEVALFPAIHPGHAVGSLSAAEATRLADLVDVFNGPGLAAWIDEQQIFRLRELSPA